MKSYKWNNITPKQCALPLPRAYHTSIQFENSIFIFGGIVSNGSLNAIWEFNLKTQKWNAKKIKGIPPSKRSGHTSILYKDRMIIFGKINIFGNLF